MPKDFPLPKYKMQEIIDRLKADNKLLFDALNKISHMEPSTYVSAATLARITVDKVRS